MALPEGTRLRDIPLPALILGIAAASPFPAAAIALQFLEGGWAAYIFLNTLNYALVALGFLGGIHAGLGLAAIRAGGSREAGWWLWSIAPCLAGFGALLGFVGYQGVLLVFLAAFLAAHLADLRAVSAGAAPAWYAPCRRITTAIVLISFGILLLYVSSAIESAAVFPL